MKKSILIFFTLSLCFFIGCPGGGGNGGSGGNGDSTVTYSISGFVTSNGSGLLNVTITLSGTRSGTTTTNSSGGYSFSGLSNGTYTLTPSFSGYTFEPSSKNITITGSNQTNVNFTFNATDPEGILGDNIVLNRLSISGAIAQIGYASIPIMKDKQEYQFINILMDFSGDGNWQSYSVGNIDQEEWIIQNIPLILMEIVYSFYFSIFDDSIPAGSAIKTRIVASKAPIDTESNWDGTVPSDGIYRDLTISFGVEVFENKVQPGEGYIGSIAAFNSANPSNSLSLRKGIEISNDTLPPPEDIDYGSILVRKGMSDVDQDHNTCLPHSFANSISWLARKYGFTDKLSTPLNSNEVDPYDVTTEKGVGDLGLDLTFTYSNNNWWTYENGIKPDDMLKGKEEFVKRKKLPIESTMVKIGNSEERFFASEKAFVAKDINNYREEETTIFDQIKTAMQDKCDVEIVVGDGKRGHAVTVVGFSDITIGSNDYRSIMVHDPATKTKDDCYQITGDNKDTIGNFKFFGKDENVKVEYMITEKYDATKTGELTVDPISFNFTHTIGQTSLPQFLGALDITTPGFNVDWSITEASQWLGFTSISCTTPSYIGIYFTGYNIYTPQDLSGYFIITTVLGDSVTIPVTGEVK